MNTFSYEEVTEHIENSIQSLNDLKLKTDSLSFRNAHGFAAVALYESWFRLTSSHQKEGDDARLRRVAGLGEKP